MLASLQLGQFFPRQLLLGIELGGRVGILIE